jgi:O-acetylserine/cysteine efflux transporter
MRLREVLLALCVPLFWSFGFTFSKAGLTEFPPFMLMGMRFTLTAFMLVWFFERPKGYYLQVFWIALVSATVQYGLTFYGLSMIDASLAIIVVQLEVPFGVLVAAIILRDRPGLARCVGIALALVGVVFIAGQPNLDRSQWFPLVLTGSGAMVWAVGQIMVKQLKGAVGGFSLIAWVGMFAGPQMLIASLILETGHLEAIRNATWIGWGTVLYLAVIMTALGYGIWYTVLSRNNVSSVMPVLLLLPVFVVAESMLLLGERPGLIVLLGGGIVLEGVAVILLADYRPRLAASAKPAMR